MSESKKKTNEFSTILATLLGKYTEPVQDPRDRRFGTLLRCATYKGIVDEIGDSPKLVALLISGHARAAEMPGLPIGVIEGYELKALLHFHRDRGLLPIQMRRGSGVERFLLSLLTTEAHCAVYRNVMLELFELQKDSELRPYLYDPTTDPTATAA